jgi:hypothetical protein
MKLSWKTVDQNSTESLRLFVSDWVDRMIKAGYFTERDEVKATEIQEKVDAEMLSELVSQFALERKDV